MTAGLLAAVVVLAAALTALGWRQRRDRRRRPLRPPPTEATRILFPFMAAALSRRALDAALRLAVADNATLLPVYLAQVPLTLPLDAPLPRQARIAIGLQEAIEQRAAAFGVPVDSRIERGRSYRHALRQTIAHERYERIVVAAAAHGGETGLHPEDVAWLLDNAPGEIIVLRPGSQDRLIPAPLHNGHGPRRRRQSPRRLSRAA